MLCLTALPLRLRDLKPDNHCCPHACSSVVPQYHAQEKELTSAPGALSEHTQPGPCCYHGTETGLNAATGPCPQDQPLLGSCIQWLSSSAASMHDGMGVSQGIKVSHSHAWGPQSHMGCMPECMNVLLFGKSAASLLDLCVRLIQARVL